MLKLASSLVAVGLGLLIGCGSEETSNIPPPAAVLPQVGAPPPVASTPASSASADDVNKAKEQLGGTAQSKGQTGRLVYKVEESEEHAIYTDSVANAAIVTSAVASFNELFTFPNDVPVVVRTCDGQVNAFYSPSKHAIAICYELIDALHQAYAVQYQSDKSEEQQLAITANAIAFVLLHEVGHAFLGENKIAILGKEEDAVDDISAVLFVTAKKPEVPVHGTLAMVAFQPTSRVFSDEHSFSLQRYFNTLCLIYGSNPKAYADIVGPESEGKLPEPRAVRCPNEWTTKLAALKGIVAPFLRK